MSEPFTFRRAKGKFNIGDWIRKKKELVDYRKALVERGFSDERATELLEGIISAQLTEGGNGYSKRFQARLDEVIRIREQLSDIYQKVMELPPGTQKLPPEIGVAQLKKLYAELETNLDALSRLNPKEAFDPADRITDVRALLDKLQGGTGEPVSPTPTAAIPRVPAPEGTRPRAARKPGRRGPRLPEDLAKLAGGDTRAQRGLRRLVERGHQNLLENLVEVFGENEESRQQARPVLHKLEELDDKQLDALSAIQRIEEDIGGLGRRESERSWYDILDFERSFRDDFLSLIGDLKDVVDEGLGEAIKMGLRPNISGNDIQGVLGVLFAAKQLKSEFPGGRMKFEVAADGRGIDIQVHASGRIIDVEVKTNLAGSPTVNKSQIKKDLIRHAADAWEDLLYRYAPAAGDLETVRKAMRELLQEPEVQAAWRRAGIPSLDTAQSMLEARLGASTERLVDYFNY